MKLVLTVDSHIRFDYKKLNKVDKECFVELTKTFTYSNPEFYKNQKLGFSTRGIPQKLQSYKKRKTGTIAFNRGCLPTIRKILKKHGHTVKIYDHRYEFEPVNFGSKIVLRDEQKEPVRRMLKKTQGIVRGPCSCIDGDAIIRINRGGKGFSLNLERLFQSFHQNHPRYNFDPDIKTRVRSYNGSTVQLHDVVDVTFSGKRLTFELKLVNGVKLRATPEHKIMTVDGWKPLVQLTEDDFVLCDTPKPVKTSDGEPCHCKSKRERMICNLWFHPYATHEKTNKDSRGFTRRLTEHRAIYEAFVNNISLEEYVQIFRNDEEKSKRLKVFDPKDFVVHHKNFDHFDNSVENLELMPQKEHSALHSLESKFNFGQGIPVPVGVKSVSKPRFRHTYDIHCAEPFHNFTANDIIVHNSGKTVMLYEALACANQPAVVIVWNTDHQKQWLMEAQKFLSLKPSEIGGCGGIFKKPKFGKLNLCMQQSLWKPETLEFFVDRIGFVGGDEVQKYGARTFQETINCFPAKYRIGVSANERRKDGKQFLIYDSFGKVIHEMSDKDVGSRRPAKVFLIPTKFHSEDYDETGFMPNVITEMGMDEERNALILKAVKRSIKKKKVCLVLTERKYQALYLKFALSGYSVGLLLGQTSNRNINESGWQEEWKAFMKGFDHNAEFHRVKKLAEQRKLDVIIATQKGDVGINVRTIDHTFITTPTGTNIERFNQQKGRCERDHGVTLEKLFGVKSTPRVYYFWDTAHEKFQQAGNRVMRKYKGSKILRLKGE